MTEEMLKLTQSPVRSPVSNLSKPFNNTPPTPPSSMSMDFSNKDNSSYVMLIMEDF